MARPGVCPFWGIYASKDNPSIEGFALVRSLFWHPSNEGSALADGAEPRAATARTGLLDQGAAAVARATQTAVDLEFPLHPPTRVGAVAEIGALAANAEPQRLADALTQPGDLLPGQLAGRPQRVDAGVPE